MKPSYFFGSVYLAGPIAGLSYDNTTNWRSYASRKLLEHDILAYSPMRAKEFLDNGCTIDAIHNHVSHPLTTNPGIVTRDLFDVLRSDVILINFLGATTVSKGTHTELGFAARDHKPIIVAMETEGNINDGAFVRVLAGFIVPDLNEAINLAIAILLP